MTGRDAMRWVITGAVAALILSAAGSLAYSAWSAHVARMAEIEMCRTEGR